MSFTEPKMYGEGKLTWMDSVDGTKEGVLFSRDIIEVCWPNGEIIEYVVKVNERWHSIPSKGNRIKMPVSTAYIKIPMYDTTAYVGLLDIKNITVRFKKKRTCEKREIREPYRLIKGVGMAPL